MITIRKLLARDQEPLNETFPQQEEGRFEDYYIEHLRQLRLVFVAFEEDEAGNREYFGYVSILWEAPSTALWQRSIPEIVDIFVQKNARRQGIASALIAACENAAREKAHRKLGLSVRHGEDFAAARALYEKLGYKLLAQSKTEAQLVKEL
jgi:ribosomal protein S18 acetylase RimI-like enzyme